MKNKTVNFWIFQAIVPCAILCAVFAYSASAFQHESGALFNSFILLLSLSFGGTCNAMLGNLVTFKAWKRHTPLKSERVF